MITGSSNPNLDRSLALSGSWCVPGVAQSLLPRPCDCDCSFSSHLSTFRSISGSSNQSEGEVMDTPAAPPATPCPTSVLLNGDVEYVGTCKGARQFLVVDHVVG